MNTKRSIAVVSALILLVILGVGHLFVPVMPDATKIPLAVVYADVALGVLSLVAAYGAWNLKRWGLTLTFIVAALNIVSAAPGVMAAPSTGLRVVTAAYVLVSLLIIGLMAISAERNVNAHRPATAQK